jgi:hypothetical protein
MVKAFGRAYWLQAIRGPTKNPPSSSATSTSKGPPVPKPAEIVAALGDVGAIDSYATLLAEMVDLFTSLADYMKDSAMSVPLRSSARWRPRSTRFLMTCWPS